MSDQDIASAARSLIAAPGAVAAAERAAANVQRLGMLDNMRRCERVAKAVKEIEAASPH